MNWIKGHKEVSKEIQLLISETLYPLPNPLPQLKSNRHANFIKLAQMKRELHRKEDNSEIPFLLLFCVNHFLALLCLTDGFHYERNHPGAARTTNQTQACKVLIEASWTSTLYTFCLM